MIVIGERINSTRPAIQAAIKARSVSSIVKEVLSQARAGADFIDINCAMTSGDELQDIEWAVSVIQNEIKDVSICIDSPNYLAIERALSTYKGKGSLMINSITGEEERINRVLPLALKYKAGLIALTMDKGGMPNTAEERRNIAAKIYDKAKKEGFDTAKLYFDPLIRPISTEPNQAKEFLRAIPMIKSIGNVRTVCGLSNVSFGLPNRGLINSIFLSMAIHSGLDAAILDPTDKHITSSLKASQALLGLDEYCGEYIKTFREGKLI